MSELKIGDWVNSYSKGIYRVERIIDRYYDESERPFLRDNKIGDKFKERMIVSKRLLNSKFKKSFSYESCSEYFISHLSKEQFSQLQEALKNNPKLLSELDSYQIPTLTTIYNMDLQIDAKEDLKKIERLIEFIKSGKTFLDIENEMVRLDIMRLKPQYFGNYRFQLFNFDEEYKEKRKIWRDAELTANEQ